MEVLFSTHFQRDAKRLSKSKQKMVEERLVLFIHNPFDSILKTHKLTGSLNELWSFSIDFHLRVIFEFIEKQKVLFHSIGDHSIYD